MLGRLVHRSSPVNHIHRIYKPTTFHLRPRSIASAMSTTTREVLATAADFKPRPVQPIVLTPSERQIRTLITAFSANYDAAQPPGTPCLETRITGGWVRDKLLGRPSHDIDIAVNRITGLEFAEALNEYIGTHAQELGIEPRHVHKIERNPMKSKHLETATTRLFGLDVDFVNLRSEEYAQDSRIPEKMEFGTALEDALRRDATLNALFYNLQTGAVEDWTEQGIHDLEAGVLRTPLEPVRTFDDDPLRVLRLIRFASSFGFRIASECVAAMQDPLIEVALMKKISRERVGIEVAKALTSERPQLCLALIEETGLYSAIFNLEPAFHAATGQTVPEHSQIGVSLGAAQVVLSDGPRLLVDILAEEPLVHRLHFWLAVGLHPWEGIAAVDEKKKPVAAVRQIVRDGLKLSTHDAQTVAAAMSLHSDVSAAAAHTESMSRKELGLLVRRCGEQWKLFFLYALFKDLVSAATTPPKQVLAQYAELTKTVTDLQLQEAWALKPVLNGKDISKLYGSKGGQWLARALQLLVEHQLEEPGLTKEEAADYMVQHKADFV